MNAFRIVIAIIALAVSPFGLCGGGVSHPGKVSIETTYVVPDVGLAYCRTCCHLKSGMFSAVQLEVPTPKTEWRLCKDEPKYKWEIDPKPAGTVRGETTSTLFVDLAETDFPKSFVVSVVVSWRVEREDGSESEIVTARAEMDFDAIKYSYTVKSCSGNPIVAGAALIDSHEGEILITAEGCRRTELLNIVMSAAVTNSWQNEVDSIEMNILGGCNDLSRTIPCPYWYAKSGNPPDCCYSNSAEYKFTLKADGCSGHIQFDNVSLPSDDHESRMSPAVKMASAELVSTNLTNEGDIKAEIEIHDFNVSAMAVTCATSQYKAKIFEEEKTHRKQVLRVKGFGFEDMYSICEALEGFDIKLSSTGGAISIDLPDEEELVETIREMRSLLLFEKNVSDSYWNVNYAYSEAEAKRLVEFREAYLYHCTYEAKLGSNVEKISKDDVRRRFK